MIKKVKLYFLNVLIAIDVLANCIAGGDPDETISARLGRNYKNSELRKFVDWIFGNKHCEISATETDKGDEVWR